jgi:threonine synthase
VLTGNGLKDPSTALENGSAGFHAGLQPDLETVARVLGF